MNASILIVFTLLLIAISNCKCEVETEIEAVDTYLTKNGLRKSLIIDTIDWLENKDFIIDDPIVGEKIKGLVRGQNTDTIIGIFKNLLKTAENCEEEELDFLALLVSLLDIRVLGRFSKSRLHSCWTKQLKKAPRRLQVSIGKMPETFIEELDLMSCEFAAIFGRKKSRLEKIIEIETFNPGVMLKDQQIRMESMKEFNKNALRYMENVVSAIIEAHFVHREKSELSGNRFDDITSFFTLHLVRGCNKMLTRVNPIMNVLTKYDSFVEDKDKLIAQERANNTNFDENIERYKICKFLIFKRAEIGRRLKNIKPKN